MMIAMCMVSLLMMQKQKKNKKGVDDNPEVGYRYWGDAMSALATLSPRTSAVWFNRVFQQGEEYTEHWHMPGANAIGERHNIGGHGVNTIGTTAFRANHSANWENESILRRLCQGPYFTRYAGENPQYPTHYPGVAMIFINQGYMGLNAATLQPYIGVISSIPGTISYLKDAGPEYANDALWVRWRETLDLSWTIGINPVAIVADILMDQHPKEKINWASFAYVGKKLIEEMPYMWFSCAMGPQTQQEAAQYIMTRAKIAQKRMPDGTIGLKLIGEMPSNGPAAFTVIDAMRDFKEFSFSKDSNDEADVLNELRGEYSAARYNLENTASADYEGHMLGADMHVVNTGNIVLTGVRKQQTQDLDFLSWPDDAKAYLWEVLSRSERPYLKGSITGGMFFSKFSVGDCLRIKVIDQGLGMVFDRVFEVQETSIAGYPNEEVTLEVEESSAWYGILEECVDAGEVPNSNPEGGWDTGQDPLPKRQILATIPMIVMMGSPHLCGAPAAYLTTSGVLEDQAHATTFLVADCQPDSPSLEEDEIGSEASPFPLHAILTEPITLKAGYPGFVSGKEIVARVWTPEGVTSLRPVWDTLGQNCINFSGTQSVMFSGSNGVTANYIFFSEATMTNPSGRAVCMRAISIVPYEVDNEIYVRIQGLYLTDGPQELVLPRGSVIAILAQSTAMSQYEWSPMPLPAMFGQTAQVGGARFPLRTIVGNSREDIPWSQGYCATYQLDDTWMRTPTPVIYGANSSTPPHLPSTDAIYIASLSDRITFLISAADLTNIKENKELYGISMAYTADLDMSTVLYDTEISKQAESRNSGISYINVTLTLKHAAGATILERALTQNRVNHTTSLAELGVAVGSGAILATEFTIYYKLRTQALEEPTNLRSITVAGPRIYYG